MKIKVLTRINSLIAVLLGVLGFGGCSSQPVVCEYGVPHASLAVSGSITNQANKPLENIQVTVKGKGDNRVLGEVYSAANGQYTMTSDYVFPEDSFDILVTDKADVYESDSLRVKAEYDRTNVASNDTWNDGIGIIRQDFQLKNK